MKKERIFYLDFIRAFATITIVITHFNAIFLMFVSHPMPEKAFITTKVANIYIGDFGVSLFFIISGAALMYVYDKSCKLATFYKKRLVSLFPMYWMVYIIDFLIVCYLDGGIRRDIPKWKFIYSFLGMDHYLSEYIGDNFSRPGEWFLGCIIIIYMLFPLLRLAVKKLPIPTMIVLLVIAFVTMKFEAGVFPGCNTLFEYLGLSCVNVAFPFSKNVLVRLPEFVFGMIFIKYIRKVHWSAFLVSAIILILNTVLKPSYEFFTKDIQTAYVGVCSFLVLVFICKFIECQPTRYISSVVSKYSYAVFLVHHVVITRLTYKIDKDALTRTDSYLLFFLCAICIGFVTRWTFDLHKCMMKSIGQMFQKEKDVEEETRPLEEIIVVEQNNTPAIATENVSKEESNA